MISTFSPRICPKDPAELCAQQTTSGSATHLALVGPSDGTQFLARVCRLLRRRPADGRAAVALFLRRRNKMGRCPNCGFKDYTGMSRCGCTWDKQLEAARITKAERRRELARQGHPVIVDHQSSRSARKTRA